MKKDNKGKGKKPNRPPCPKLNVVVPFPKDRVLIDRDINNAIRRLRRAEVDNVMIIGSREDGSIFITSNSMKKKEALWLLEVAKLDLFDLMEWEKVDP